VEGGRELRACGHRLKSENCPPPSHFPTLY
jgi:hypothetical protein